MSKRVEQFIPVTGIDKNIAANPGRCIDNPNRLRLSLSYTTGGVNYFSVYPVSFMIDLKREHRPEYGVTQVIVAFIPGEVGEQVLDGMVDVFLRRDLLVIPVTLSLYRCRGISWSGTLRCFPNPPH